MPTMQAISAAILENIHEIIDSAEDDDDAQEQLAAYEELLQDPARMQALAAGDDEDDSSHEDSAQLGMGRTQPRSLADEIRNRVRVAAARVYPTGTHGGRQPTATEVGLSMMQETIAKIGEVVAKPQDAADRRLEMMQEAIIRLGQLAENQQTPARPRKVRKIVKRDKAGNITEVIEEEVE